MVALLSVLILPLPTLLLDLGLALSITAAVLVLMVALFLNRPLDFSTFPTLLLLTTLLRLSLNVAVTRLILSHGNEGPLAAGHVVAAFGGFLMGGDVVIGLIIFSILLVVNFMVITKGSGRIAEVAARFSLDSMPGKQMAIDADMSAGLIDEKEPPAAAAANWRRKAASTARWTARRSSSAATRSPALIITVINILGGLAIGLLRHGMAFADAAATFTTLTAGDGLVSQIPALLVSTAAGIVVTKGGMEGTADVGADPPARRQSEAAGDGGRRGHRARAAARPAGAAVPGARRPGRRRRLAALQASAGAATIPSPAPPIATEAADQRDAAHRHDPAGAGLWPAGAGRRRHAAADRADQGPAPLDRRRDGLRAAAGAHPGQHAARRRPLLDPRQGDRGRQRRTASHHAAGDGPEGRRRRLQGEPTREPAFGLPALWIDPALKEEALFRGCTVVDPPSVLTTHLTEVVRENMAELLSYAETQKLLDELPREQQKLVSDLIPSQITVGGVQRVLQRLLAERVSIRDLPTILEGIQEACGGAVRAIPAIVAHVRARLARQISDSHTGPGGYMPLVTLSAEWEAEFADALTGPAEDRQLAMAPSKLQEFMQKLRSCVRCRRKRRRVAGAADLGRHPQPRARHRRAHPADHAGAGAGGDLSARADPHGGDDMSRRSRPLARLPLA